MKWYLVDASAFITLAGIDRIHLLGGLDGNLYVLDAVADEIEREPKESAVGGKSSGITTTDVKWINIVGQNPKSGRDHFRKAAIHLGEDPSNEEMTGDVALLGTALKWWGSPSAEEVVIVTDDKPLRKTCKALGVPISDSIGVVIAAVERGELDPDEAKDALVSMDEVGARLSARLLRRAERLIDGAAENAS